MDGHLRQIIDYAATSGRGRERIVGPFVREHLANSGERDVHFACVWIVNCLVHFARVGHDGPYEVNPRAPFSRTLREMISGSAELSRLFVATPESLDYRPDLTPEQRRELESLAPPDWQADADV